MPAGDAQRTWFPETIEILRFEPPFLCVLPLALPLWAVAISAALMAGALAMAASGAPAQAAATSDCPAPPGAVNVALPSGLPPALRDAMGNIALPGEPFDSSDVYVKGHKYRRYIFVWNVGARWIVATEQGGIALRPAIYVYRLGKGGKTATVIDKRIGVLNNVCGAATQLAGR
jgi:hypothetical protein